MTAIAITYCAYFATNETTSICHNLSHSVCSHSLTLSVPVMSFVGHCRFRCTKYYILILLFTQHLTQLRFPRAIQQHRTI